MLCGLSTWEDSPGSPVLILKVLSFFTLSRWVILVINQGDVFFLSIAGKLVTAIMGLATVSVISAILVSHLQHRGATKRVPRWLRQLAFKHMAYLFCMCTSVPNDDKRQGSVVPNGPDYNNMKAVQVKPKEHECLDGKNNGWPPEALRAVESMTSDIDSIARNLRYLTDRVKGQEADDIVVEEWRALARVFDRLMFWLSLIIMFVVFTVLLSGRDHEH